MGQSRVDTKQKHNKENSKDEQHGSHQKPGVNTGAHEGSVIIFNT